MGQSSLDSFDPTRDVGSTVQSCPAPPPTPPPPRPTSWVGIELVDEDGRGISGEQYEVALPDGAVVRGRTAYGICEPGQSKRRHGRALIEGIDPGNCKITFPRLDKDVWQRGR